VLAANPEGNKLMNHYSLESSTVPARLSTRQPVHRHLEDLNSDNNGQKKRSLDEQDDEHEFKKPRIEGEELIDGDADARHSTR
jgi:hypothetical protein